MLLPGSEANAFLASSVLCVYHLPATDLAHRAYNFLGFSSIFTKADPLKNTYQDAEFILHLPMTPY